MEFKIYTKEEVNTLIDGIKKEKNLSKLARKHSIEMKRGYTGVYSKLIDLKKKETVITVVKNPSQKKSIFYTEDQVAIIKSELKAGKSAPSIANEYAIEFGRKRDSMLKTVYRIKKNIEKTTPVQKVVEVKVVKKEPKLGISLPEGMTFEGTPKKVILYSDHFRVFF